MPPPQFDRSRVLTETQSSGNSGSYMTKSLLETGKHTVTAITRADSKSQLSEGVQVKRVDYDDHSSLVEALKGQDALVITLGVTAPPDSQEKLINAAGDAGVAWILPNEWAPDLTEEGVRKDVPPFQKLADAREYIGRLGKSSYVGVTCGFWYEWSLAIPQSYGFDFKAKTVTLFDEGETKISTSTWPQVGRAVAALLSLPVTAGQGGDSKQCLEHYKNTVVFVNSFTVSQKDMLDSVLRVTGDKADDWTVTKEPSRERYSAGFKAMIIGDQLGFVKVMYTRIFYPDGNGNFEKNRGVINDVLGLPKEDIDEATKAAIKRSEEFQWGAH